MKLLVTGGSRSGKTRYALQRAEAMGPERIYLATAEALDDEMTERIQRHRQERGAGWRTLEEPLEVVPLLQQPHVLLFDCLTLWTSNLLMRHGTEADLAPRLEAFVEAVRVAPNSVILIANEVGMGLVPETPLGRRFRDWSGWLSQRVAGVADEVVLMVAGCALKVKG